MFQKSPLRVGSGDGEVTDSDLMLDGRGCPFIPGSSVAGVLREIYEKSPSSAQTLFGYVKEKELSDSHVLVSDAVGPAGADASDYILTVRDGIGVDEWGITIPGNKYDFQAAETRRPFYSVLEWSGDERAYESEVREGLEPLMEMIGKDGISFGARTTRGYGEMSVTVRRKVFDFPGEIERWLKFDPLDEKSFEDAVIVREGTQDSAFIKIHADLAVRGSVSVRVSTARAEMLEDGSVPDSVPLTNLAGRPVIPGTSWAGVFRHHMKAVLRQTGLGDSGRQEGIDLLFGKGKDENHIRSALCFGETVLAGGAPYSITRNAVERFTQAPKNTALFTNRVWQGGRGTLDIRFRKGELAPLQSQLLAAALIDLDLGLLTFGGASGTGHGRCELEKITVNGTDVTGQLKNQDSHFLEEYL